MNQSSDVLIVGGGPAGLATAIALRQRGASVTVADSMRPPIDKACGEGLMPDSLRDLALLGVHFAPEEGSPFRGIRFVHGADVATAQFPADSEFDTGIGIRRQSLHNLLVQRASEAGVKLRWGSPVQFEKMGKTLIAGEHVGHDWLVGADGQASRLRRWTGLEGGTLLSKRFGFRQHFTVEPWSPYVEIYWGRSGQAYVTPVGPKKVCVATVACDPHCRLNVILDELPELKKRLAGRSISNAGRQSISVDSERGAVTTTRRLKQVARGRTALVGDASGSADAITGEGMGMSFRQALLLAECIEAADLARYNREHPSTLKLPQTMARIMLLMDGSKTLRTRAIGMLASEPDLFRRLLGVHLGSESLPRLVATHGAQIVWRLTWPRPGSKTRTTSPISEMPI